MNEKIVNYFPIFVGADGNPPENTQNHALYLAGRFECYC